MTGRVDQAAGSLKEGGDLSRGRPSRAPAADLAKTSRASRASCTDGVARPWRTFMVCQAGSDESAMDGVRRSLLRTQSEKGTGPCLVAIMRRDQKNARRVR